MDEILDDIYSKRNEGKKCSKRLTEQKISNNSKSDATVKEENDKAEKSFLKRVRPVDWKHRKDVTTHFMYMGATIGPKKV